jgi:Zn-dependent metalloprotease
MAVSRFYRSALLVTLLIAELVLGAMDPVNPAQSAAPTNPGPNSIQAQAPASDCQGGKGFGLNAANKNLLNQLQSAIGSGGTISCHDYTGKVRFLSTEPGKPLTRAANLTAKASPEEATRNFMTNYGSLFGLTDQSKELNVMRVMTGDQNNAYVRFQQVYQGVPVIAGEIIVQVDPNQQVVSAGGEMSPDLSVNVTPKLSADQARSQAFAKVARNYRVDPVHLTASTPELAIYDPRLLADTEGFGELVWKMTVEGDGTTATTEPFQEFVLVDANSGAIPLNFNQIEEALNRWVCDANYVGVSKESDCTSPVLVEGGNPNAFNADVKFAYIYAGATYDFYKNNFNRDSLNGAGMTLKSTVNFCYTGNCPNYQNAFWNGTQMYYGHGYAVADDVVGHELTHGFTQYTSGLFYSFDSGAINESLSDTFGEFIDQTDGMDGCAGSSASQDWLIGEDLPSNSTNCNGQIRSMKDPTIYSDPDKTSSPYYTTSLSDNAGVHTNSGIGNKAAYLIAAGTAGEAGGSFNGQTITGLGIPKAAWIYYELETHVLTSGANYRDLFNYLPRACTNLIGTHSLTSTDITSTDCQQVTKAVTATEMNMNPPGSRADAPICTSGQPTNLFFDNMENPASGNWLTTNSNLWAYSNNKPYSGTTSLYGYDYYQTSDSNIYMNNSVALPANAYLNFRQYFQFDYAPGYNYDGGMVEYSINGGSTWTDAGSLFDYNGYNGTISNYVGTTNTQYGRSAFVNLSRNYYSSRMNLSSLAGKSVKFRFRISTDSSVSDVGWFIDDVQIYTCPLPTTTGLTSSLNPAYWSQPVTFNAVVNPTSGTTPTGNIAFMDGVNTLTTVALSGGRASYTTSSLTVGSHSITAVYAGDSNNITSTSNAVNQQVIIAPTTVTLVTSASPVFAGQSVTFKAIVKNPWGGIPTGSVTFNDNNSALGSAVSLDGTGSATYTTTSLGNGNHPITAVYGGDSNNSGSTSNGVNQQILAAGCSNLTVTTTSDDNSCNSLRQAIAVAHLHAASTGSTTVEISSSIGGPVQIDVANGGITLGLGITLQRQGGGCGLTGPDTYIQAGTGSTGDGITMNYANLDGIWISGFNGRQIVTYGGVNKNTLFCVKSTKANPA